MVSVFNCFSAQFYSFFISLLFYLKPKPKTFTYTITGSTEKLDNEWGGMIALASRTLILEILMLGAELTFKKSLLFFLIPFLTTIHAFFPPSSLGAL